jgi:hypothetical protein
MTPDDMEGRLEGDLRFAGKDLLAVTRTADLRALLLDYQERGRALERIANLEGTSGFEQMPNQPSGHVRQVFARDIARATLKGKSQ